MSRALLLTAICWPAHCRHCGHYLIYSHASDKAFCDISLTVLCKQRLHQLSKCAAPWTAWSGRT